MRDVHYYITTGRTSILREFNNCQAHRVPARPGYITDGFDPAMHGQTDELQKVRAIFDENTRRNKAVDYWMGPRDADGKPIRR
jgi:hypothetical protein